MGSYGSRRKMVVNSLFLVNNNLFETRCETAFNSSICAPIQTRAAFPIMRDASRIINDYGKNVRP